MASPLSDVISRQPSASVQKPLRNQSPFIRKKPNVVQKPLLKIIPSRIVPTPVIIKPTVANLPPNPSLGSNTPIPRPIRNNTPKVPTRAQILSKDLSNKPPPAP